jgi:anti-sigma factor RsiW
MSEHQAIYELLPLCAAGALDERARRQVEQHLADCPSCRSEFAMWSAYTRGLKQLPQPAMAREVLLRTQARVLREQSLRTQRAHTPLVVLGLSVFGWSVSYLLWVVVYAATGGELVVLQTNIMRLDVWALASTVLVWTSGAVAAILLARSRKEWREAV